MSHPSAAALARIPSTRSYHRGFAAGDATYIGYNASRPTDALRRRATSDPRAPSHDVSNLGAAARPKTQIELDLERADRLRRQRRFTLTNADVAAKDKDIAAAEDELREDLQMIGHRGMEITRRLDYGYYNLLEKVGNLASVIQSLQSLSTQSGQLVRNLEGEAEKIDDMVKSKASDLRKGFEERDERAKQLESRGKEVQRLAEEMGQRLETARAKVEKWEEEESQRQEVWSRFVARVWGMAGSVVFLVVAIVVAKEVWLGRAAIKDLIAPGQGNVLHNTSLAVGMRKLEGAKERIPEDVKRVLVEIEERNRNSRSPLVQTHPIESQVRTEEPEILRVLNEL
ncbi:uncharacterized protein HMPREF1541_08208 [Cyphellophora europaea CBS 101466]|uniref:Uncharacterized protein n=1 Tax=Cyphellophora europaea (strain CBS 101466) TaxID=1220924 RepID=W2RND9_CYPE1|nr:uncharacterized protein HMPREF1541_08208 [Cyphellophora europaea CBS 101466]ETN37218.1 hypothetical protein HMPREF1541_08208 [Cyphellophora europaea CBS 101466]